MQLATQHREVIVIPRMKQTNPVLRTTRDDAIALGQRKAHLSVAMQVGVLATQENDLDHHRVRHGDRTIGQRVRCDRHEQDRGYEGIHNGSLRRERVGG